MQPYAGQQVTRYCFEDVQIIIDGRPITGIAQEDVTCVKDNDNHEWTEGNYGDAVLNRHLSPTGTITFQVLANCVERPFLDSLADRRDFFSCWVMYNGEPREVTGGNKCAIQKNPDRTYGQNIANREYAVMIGDYCVLNDSDAPTA